MRLAVGCVDGTQVCEICPSPPPHTPASIPPHARRVMNDSAPFLARCHLCQQELRLLAHNIYSNHAFHYCHEFSIRSSTQRPCFFSLHSKWKHCDSCLIAYYIVSQQVLANICFWHSRRRRRARILSLAQYNIVRNNILFTFLFIHAN